MLSLPEGLNIPEESSQRYVSLPNDFVKKVMEQHGPEIDTALDYLLIEAFRFQRSNFTDLQFNQELEAMIDMTFSEVTKQLHSRYHSLIRYRIDKSRYGERPWERNQITWNVILIQTNRLVLSMTN